MVETTTLPNQGTQTSSVLQYMVKREHITQGRADQELGIRDLRKIISNIRALGFEVSTQKGRDINNRLFTKYKLSKPSRLTAINLGVFLD